MLVLVPELGCLSLDEKDSLRHPTNVMKLIERNDHFDPQCVLGVYAEAARMCREITEDEQVLRRFAKEAQKQTYDPT